MKRSLIISLLIVLTGIAASAQSYGILSANYRHDFNQCMARYADARMDAVGVEYVRGFGLGINMALEAGLGLDYAFCRSGAADVDALDLTVPVRLVFRLPAGRGVMLTPYAGVYFRAGVAGGTSVDGLGAYDDGMLRRINGGWNVGIGTEWHRILARVSFGTGFAAGDNYGTVQGQRPLILGVTAGYRF